MTTRPTARAKSALAGASPIAENVQNVGEKKEYPKKDAFYPEDEVVNRAKNALVGLEDTERFDGWKWSDYVNRALDAYTRGLEAQYNDDKPFPQRPPDSLGPGRRRSSMEPTRRRTRAKSKNSE